MPNMQLSKKMVSSRKMKVKSAFNVLEKKQQEGGFLFEKEKNEITIRSSAAGYLTFAASAGDRQDSIEIGYTTWCTVEEHHSGVKVWETPRVS